MEKYQKILEEVQQVYPKAGEDLDEILLQSSVALAGDALFLNVTTGYATCNGKKFSFNTDKPEALDSSMQVFNPRYIILTASSKDVPKNPVTASPESLRPEGNWGCSVWEVYKENYEKRHKKEDDQVNLKLLYYSLLLSQNRSFKIEFFEKSVLNIFGWIYDPDTCTLTDLYLDVFFSFDEDYISDGSLFVKD